MGFDIYKKKAGYYEKELKRIDKAGITDKNKELIRKYHQHLFAKGCGDLRAIKVSGQLRRIAQILGKDFDAVTKDDLERLVATINRDPLCKRVISHCYTKKAYPCGSKVFSPETKLDYWMTTKSFFVHLDKRYREVFEDWKPNFGTKKREIGNIITEEDMEKTLRACSSTRDKAILSLLHETGARAGEILGMKIKDVIKADRFLKVRFFGKTGERRVLIVHSVPYLMKWLEEHKLRENPDAHLWISDNPKFRDEPLYHPGLRKLIVVAFRKANLNHVKHNPHFFRHSRATINAKFMTDVQMRLFFGWSNGSTQVATYVHASGRDVDSAVLTMNGIAEKEEVKNKPKFCPICKSQNTSISDFCSNCGHALSLKVAMESEAKMKEELDKTFQLFTEIAQNPALMAEFEAFKEKFGANAVGATQ